MIEVAGVAQDVSPKAVVVPVATTPGRVRVRGYNQARVLAQVVAAGLGRPLIEALVRPHGRTQVSLAPGQRRTNVEGSFRPAAGGGSRIEAAEVILVDDVLTTGATILSAAETLERMGAESVRALTFARAMPFDEGRERQVGS
jgi:predicted amidophosphoribosyltransferase